MKKSFLLLAGAAAVLASCSKTETTEMAQGPAIGFSDAWIGNAVESKAAVDEITEGNISEFIVYGGYGGSMTNVFDNIRVSGTAGTDDWKYEGNPRHWVPEKEYKFAAYAPQTAGSNGTITSDFSSGHLTFTDYIADPSNQQDLIYATQTASTKGITISASTPGKVQFSFGHLLSMIKFTFKSGFAEGVRVTVDNLKVSGMVSKGTYTGNDSQWAMGSATVEEGSAFTEMSETEAENVASPGENKSAASRDFAVIPQTIEKTATTHKTVTVSFDVRVQTSDGEYIVGNADSGEAISATLPDYTWKAGNRYNYSVTIKGDNVGLYPIEFGTPQVTAITPDDDFNGNDEVVLPTTQTN